MTATLPRAVKIREVGPRDGFQNEPEVIPTDVKVWLINALARTGLERVLPRARAAGLRCEAVISVAFGCPYEGRVAPARVFEIAERLVAAGAQEIGFGDTAGMANPGATGNVAIEDVVSMLHESGIETGVDLAALLQCSRAVRGQLGRPLGRHTLVAGPVDWHG